MARWERTVAVVSYALAQSKASARLAALFFTLLAQASVLRAASPLVPAGCVRGSNSVRPYALNEPADCSSELRALAFCSAALPESLSLWQPGGAMDHAHRCRY